MPKVKVRYTVHLITSGKWREAVEDLTLPRAMSQARSWLKDYTGVEVCIEKQTLSVNRV